MFLGIIVFFSFISLIILHEFGHFLVAKKFGVKVEEFGIGYPPRIFGKKIGETLYSLNLLPFGAFVKLTGEIERIKRKDSFSAQSIGKRALIALGGVFSFWIMATMLFSLVFRLGAPLAVSDETNSNLIKPKVQIAEVTPQSPAQKAGLAVGDTILQLQSSNSEVKNVTKIKAVQEFTNAHLGEEIILTVERGPEVFKVKIVPRLLAPAGEGPMGVALVRTAIKKYPWYLAPFQGILATGNLTFAIIQGYLQAISNLVKGLAPDIQVTGPVGIFHLLNQASKLGLSYFLNFLGMISIYLAIVNVLPIPAADGGKLLFLGIEWMRKKPISQPIEQKITFAFFTLIVTLMIWVTIQDITRIF